MWNSRQRFPLPLSEVDPDNVGRGAVFPDARRFQNLENYIGYVSQLKTPCSDDLIVNLEFQHDHQRAVPKFGKDIPNGKRNHNMQ